MEALKIIVLLYAIAAVVFMQAGFIMVETGFTRTKNAGNVIVKNLLGFCIGNAAFLLLGFGVMFGDSNNLLGSFDLFTQNDYSGILPPGVTFELFFVIYSVCCAIPISILFGSIGERTKLISYCVLAVVMSVLVYPVVGHWLWGNGWLAKSGYHDFGGASAIFVAGGTAALAGTWITGSRIGKFTKQGKSKAIPGHNLTLSGIGVCLLWFCWFGFQSISVISMRPEQILSTMGTVFMNTNLSIIFAILSAILFSFFRYKKTDISMILSGAIAGLTAITAGCDIMGAIGSSVIGVLSGILAVVMTEFLDRRCKLDDPIGAVSIYGICGVFGILAVGFFGKNRGIFYGYGMESILVQLKGVVAIVIWILLIMSTTLILIKHTIGIRVSAKDEIEGLDATEHGMISTFADLSNASDFTGYNEEVPMFGSEKTEDAVPVLSLKGVSENATKLTKVEIIMNQGKFESLKKAMNEIGVTGMTVTQVLGCGIQKGALEYYRGVPLDMQLLPKIQVEIVLAKVPVIDVIDTARKVLYTGHIGDGKIFVYDVENVVKVRTAETGYAALQGAEE